MKLRIILILIALLLFATTSQAATPNAAEWLSDVKTTAAKKLQWACYGGYAGLGGWVEGDLDFLRQRIRAGLGDIQSSQEANQAAAARLPGTQISCANQTGLIHTPTATYYVEDGRWTRAEMQAVSGTLRVVWDADQSVQASYEDRTNQITIAIDRDGSAEVTGLKMDRFSADASSEVSAPYQKHGYRENELIEAANQVWQMVPDMPPNELVKNLLGNPKIQRLFGQYVQRQRQEQQKQP